jgi:hypothetical protein
MNNIQILIQDQAKVLKSLKLGEIESMELAVDQVTDDFMLYGLRSGLIDELANSFPDPREECEITIKQILSASIAGHYQDMYAMSQSPYALHSPVLLSELGLKVYANTESGQEFATKTLRQLRRQQARSHEVSMLVYAGRYYAVFPAKYLIWLLLGLPKEVQELLKRFNGHSP